MSDVAQSATSEPALKSAAFRREREATWRELETLVNVAESRGVRRLSASELVQLARLYRATLSALSVARAISLDRNLLEYLETLGARAYFVVYGPKRGIGATLQHFFGVRLPEAVRECRRHVGLASLFLLLGVAVGWVMTSHDLEHFHTFVDVEYAGGRGPTATTEELRDVLYGVNEHGGDLSAFASYLFSHNAQIGIMSFALGFLAGVPVFFLLFLNGLVLGAFGALHAERGLGLDFWGWVLPHGVPEIFALVLCGAAGLVIGESLVFPGRHGRIENLRLRGRTAGVIVVGAVVMLFYAAFIEGFFRQLVEAPAARYSLAALNAALLAAYFIWMGRRRWR